jgi:beta-phosphoglucomutase
MKKVLTPDAVIFDMDGVIVDSMPYHFLAWYEALRPYGVRVGCFDVYAKEGERWAKSLKDFLRKEGIVPSKKLLSEIFVFRQKIFKKYFKRFIFKDADQVLCALKNKGYSLALVTGTPDYEVRKILPRRIYRIFDVVVAGNNVKKGKPHPEPYLKASKMLKVEPGRCVVIENAPYGIESAKRAGMYCIAVSTSLPKEFLKTADAVVDRLNKVAELIRI